MESISTQLLVIGAGPGGYVCAIRAAQLGIKTAIVESESPGGTCLNVGCVPSKALIHAADEYHKLLSFSVDNSSPSELGIKASSASIDFTQTLQWKNGIVKRLSSGVGGLLKKANVQSLVGSAKFRDGKSVVVSGQDGDVLVRCEHIVIATGSEPIEIPSLPFNDSVLSSTGALALSEIPKKLAVVGGGYIGLELGLSFAKLGATVTIVESSPHILPQYDEQLTAPVQKRLEQLGVKILLNTKASQYSESEKALKIESSNGQAETVLADKVLVTVGRRARMSGWGLEELALATRNGCVLIDELCLTSMRGVYAIGDITGEPMLAHRAMAQGEMVARHIAGQNVQWDNQCIPAVCFTDPEIVSAGLLPHEAEEAGHSFSVSSFPFMANARSLTLQREDGFVRVVADKESNVILGIQAVGPGVSELSAAFSIAIEMGALTDDIAATIHAHPTLSEGLQEACKIALGHGLHI